MRNSPWISPIGVAMLLGLTHAMADLTSLAVVYRQPDPADPAYGEVWRQLTWYNVLAFGLQLPLGLIADRWRSYRTVALAGLVLLAAAIVLEPLARTPAVVLAGLGNALFHVGAGAIVLSCSPGRAAEAGIFVAPGALGLWLGVQLGVLQCPCPGRLIFLLALAAMIVTGVVPHAGPWGAGCSGRQECLIQGEEQPRPGRSRSAILVFLGVGLLLMSIGVRSTLGGELSAAWREPWEMGLAMALAALAGKAIGGLVADRIGWGVASVLPLLLAAAMLPQTLEPGAGQIAAATAMLVQMTMAVTLAAISTVLVRYPASSFGLASLGLLLGTLPASTELLPSTMSGGWLIPLAIGAALAIDLGLRMAIESRLRPKEFQGTLL